MLLRTYVTVTLFLAGAPQALARRAEAKRAEEGGLATLEWVALAIVAVTIAATSASSERRRLGQRPSASTVSIANTPSSTSGVAITWYGPRV